MEYKDYYKTLGVEKNANAEEIKKQYRRLARKYHPDVSSEKNAEENFKEVKEAYEEILSLIKQYKYIESVHDFRVVGEGEVKNLIFDIVVDPSKKFPVTDADLMDKICINIKKYHPCYNCIITIDKNFI